MAPRPADAPSSHARRVNCVMNDGDHNSSELIRGASPLGLPYTRSRSPLRRLAPIAWLTRCRSFATDPRGFAPRTPLVLGVAIEHGEALDVGRIGKEVEAAQR